MIFKPGGLYALKQKHFFLFLLLRFKQLNLISPQEIYINEKTNISVFCIVFKSLKLIQPLSVVLNKWFSCGGI
ncbi:hypothetical protein ATZ36_12075 [Candidatus Endomicrobiellum trichonymphae]|uniref:Uncharacterized protein n=1 Tax=Endomicrobium trichonymphae TaxID=1408204 RepID=A0A1E5IN19_ENDTX|nr:hypothetical protein ATZ36_12075 [Candidatus Endomicrobium trichonymphae]